MLRTVGCVERCDNRQFDAGPAASGWGGHPDQTKYCRQDPTGTTCADRLRWEARYTVANIPTNKQLVVRATGPNAAPLPRIMVMLPDASGGACVV